MALVAIKQLRNVKAGAVAAGSFSGNPKTAAVTFAAAMPSTSYAISIQCVSTGDTFAPVVTSKAVGGFTINLGTNNLGNLTEVLWIVTPYSNVA